jgi:three-Cys-motif partner protein
MSGSDGSPLIALEVARNHELKLASEVVFLFVEEDKGRFNHLRQLLDSHYKYRSDGVFENLPSNFRVFLECGEFNSIMSNQIQRLRQNGYNLAPTMAFIDPFGYSDIRIQVLVDILNFRKCELLITYMVGFLDRFASDMLHKEILLSE